MALERTNRQHGFIDAATSQLGGPRTAAMLGRLHSAVDWEHLAVPIRALPAYSNPGAGRRPWDVVLMLKCVLLAKWFNLSDPGLEEMLQDRLSFRRFVGLSLDDATPDETTFVRFRARLRDADLDGVLFERALQQLDAKGLVLQEGTLVDATIIEASRGTKKSPRKFQDKNIAECSGNTPAGDNRKPLENKLHRTSRTTRDLRREFHQKSTAGLIMATKCTSAPTREA